MLDKNAKEALQLAKNNEILIWKLRHESQGLKEKIQSSITEVAETVVKKYTQEKFRIPKIEAQRKRVLIELEDLRNRSMRSTVIFKNIHEENESTWEDTARVLGQFISEELDINYTYKEIDMFLWQSSQRQPRFIKKLP